MAFLESFHIWRCFELHCCFYRYLTSQVGAENGGNKGNGSTLHSLWPTTYSQLHLTSVHLYFRKIWNINFVYTCVSLEIVSGLGKFLWCVGSYHSMYLCTIDHIWHNCWVTNLYKWTSWIAAYLACMVTFAFSTLSQVKTWMSWRCIINPRRACAAGVTVLGLCVCLLLNISLYARLFVPQTILTFSAADEDRKF